MARPQTLCLHKTRGYMTRACPRDLGASHQGPRQELGVRRPYKGQNILWGCPHTIRGCMLLKVIAGEIALNSHSFH